MQPTTFLYFAFGDNLTNHVMAHFSILSFKKFAPNNSRFVFYTDKPEYYAFLSSIVEVRKLDEQRLNDWQGKHKFLWRIKIMAMLDSANKDPGHLVYLDTDTFALGDITPLVKQLDNDACFMHLRESLLSEDKAKNKILMWSQTQNKTFGGMLVTQNSAMWNAGVVAVNNKDKLELLTKALASTDEMCDQNVEKWLIEQFSISQALSSTGRLVPCDQWIGHYWGHKKEFIQNINAFLAAALQKMNSIDELIQQIDIDKWKRLMQPKPKQTFFQKLFQSKKD